MYKRTTHLFMTIIIITSKLTIVIDKTYGSVQQSSSKEKPYDLNSSKRKLPIF